MKKNTGWQKFKNFCLDSLMFFAGCIVYAISVDVFTAPNNIAPGGLTGVSTVINYLFDTNIGTMIIILNIPVMIAGLIILGWKFMFRSIFCMLLSSIFIDLGAMLLPDLTYTANPLLAAMFGGVTAGAGLALIFLRGGTTGGTDVIAHIVGKYNPHMTIGRLLLIFDLMVIVGAAFVYRSLEPALYAIVTMFISSMVVDAILYGIEKGKLMYVITEKVEEVSQGIMTQIDRGATVLAGKGAYSGAERNVIMCAVRNNEAYRVRRIVHETDPNAFIIVGDATEILGEGFKPIEK